MKVKDGFSSLSNALSPAGRLTLPPTTPLLALNGTASNGTWAIWIVDNGTAATASLNYFKIEFKYTTCGNGLIDPGTNEICDGNTNCGSDCLSCINGYSQNTWNGSCGFCGDGQKNGPEICDSFTPNCNSSCTGCLNGYAATASGCGYCGDSIVNGAEVCDGSTNCNSNCLSCSGGYSVSSGICGYCGDDIKNGPEICDGT